jgi:serine/threonine protein kinase/DNA-binding beta-propeller fold protein YncE
MSQPDPPRPSPSLDAEGQIDEACDRFEAQWRAGRRPRIEEFLGGQAGAAQARLLYELLRLELEYRRKGGEQPAREEYRERFPDHRATLDRLFGGNGGTAAAEGPASTLAQERVGQGTRAPPLIPGYEVLEELGRGGMGEVYRARDPRLDRVVALKVVRTERLSPALLARLEAEARAVAQLDHPHIVKVFEVGQCQAAEGGEPVPYIALEYFPGGSLEKRLGEEPLGWREAARLVQLLAGASHHAHSRGIVHRDLKPDNVLLAPPADVEALNTPLGCPKITDFGLARQSGVEGRLTREGSVLGTPAYMAPEQAEGRSDVGPAADVFALGVILYRLLAGRVPFDGSSLTELLYRLCHDDPVSPRQLRPEVPGEVERICLDCLHKQAEQRPGALELAARLRRALACGNEEESNPPISTASKKRTRRVALLAGLCASLAALAWLAWLTRGGDGKKPNDDAGPERSRVPLPPALQVRQWRAMHYVKAGDGFDGKGPLGEQSFAARCGDVVPLTVQLSGPGYFYLIAFNFDGTEQLLWPTDENGKPDDGLEPPRLGRLRYPQGDGGALGLEDSEKGGLQAYVVAASRQPLPAYRAWRKGLGSLGWKALPAGRTVWQADARGSYAWVPGVGLDRSTLKVQPGVPPLAALCRKLAAGGVEAVEAVAFPVLPGEAPPLAVLRGNSGSVWGVAFSPDNRTLAMGIENGTVKLWDLRTRSVRATLPGHGMAVWAAAFSRDGKLLVTASDDNTARVWDAATSKTVKTLKTTAAVRAAVFGPLGATLYTGDRGGNVRVWDLATGGELRSWRAPGAMYTLALSPDGKTVATAGAASRVRLWDAATGQERLSLDGHAGPVYGLAYRPDGKVLASAGWDRVIRLWDAGSGELVGSWGGHRSEIWAVDFAPDGKTLASAGQDGTVRVWDAETGRQLASFRGHDTTVHSVVFSRDGARIASGGRDGTVHLWEAAGPSR